MKSATIPEYPQDVLAYLHRIHDTQNAAWACRATNHEEFLDWRDNARPELRKLIRLDTIENSCLGHVPSVRWGNTEEFDTFTRQQGSLETEPDLWTNFWLLRPRSEGPYPLALTLHGHEKDGQDSLVGVAHHPQSQKAIDEEDQDVAIQAVKRGFLTLAPATRGLHTSGVPDIDGKYGRKCRSHLMNCLVAGRTCIGERVWDTERFVDWALETLPVQKDRILTIGHSGGGMLNTYFTACDTRVRVAVLNCNFSRFVKPNGRISHCDCNTVPGILTFGEFYDVAGLSAPRELIVINGMNDKSHSPEDVDYAVAKLRKIYRTAGAEDHLQHFYGEGGHRYYSDIMWPAIERATSDW